MTFPHPPPRSWRSALLTPLGCARAWQNAEGDSEGVVFNKDDEQLGEAFANILAVALEQQSKKDQAGNAVDMVVRNLV